MIEIERRKRERGRERDAPILQRSDLVKGKPVSFLRNSRHTDGLWRTHLGLKTSKLTLCIECVTMTAAVDIKPLTIIKSEKVDGKCSNRFLIRIVLILDYYNTRLRHLSSQL